MKLNRAPFSSVFLKIARIPAPRSPSPPTEGFPVCFTESKEPL